MVTYFSGIHYIISNEIFPLTAYGMLFTDPKERGTTNSSYLNLVFARHFQDSNIH